MISIVAAFTATTLYLAGFSIMKVAARRMEPLRGERPFHLLGQIARSPIWMAGLSVFLLGLVPQVVALTRLPLSAAMPIFVASLIPLLLIALVFFKERLRIREWASLALIAISALLVSLSVRAETVPADEPVSAVNLLSVVVPSLLFPMLLFYLGDRHPSGRHARPIAGIAYGVSGGMAFGTAEIGVKGLAAMEDLTQAPGTLNPYVVVISAIIGFAMLLIALQRCRLAVPVSVGMITSKVHLMLAGGALYGEPWPHDTVDLALRAAAVVIVVFALLLFPRHEAVVHAVEDEASARPRPGSTGLVTGPVTRSAGRPERAYNSGPIAGPIAGTTTGPGAGTEVAPDVEPGVEPDAKDVGPVRSVAGRWVVGGE